MAYGRTALGLGASVLKATPFGGALSIAQRLPGLGGIFGGMSASEKRLKSRKRLDKLLAKVAAGTLSAKGLARLQHKAQGPYAKQAAKARAALGEMGMSPSVGAGPMAVSLAMRRPAPRRAVSRAAAPARRARKASRTAARSSRRARARSKMPAGLARYWAAKRKKRRAARTLAR